MKFSVARRYRIALPGLLLVLAVHDVAAAGNRRPPPGIWPDKVFHWYYNPAQQPAWLDADEARERVQAAIEKWQVCGLRSDYRGETGLVPGRMDGVNVVGWNAGLKRLRALTQGRAYNGQLLERDVMFNPARREFEQFPRLLTKVMAHEMGHAIGLTHANRCDAVMTLAADCPRQRAAQLPIVPTDDDLQRCKALYGAE